MSVISRLPIALAVAVALAGLPVFASQAPGIRNFDQVDAHVYRGGQPTDEGFQYLAGKLHVKTVIDLREAGHRSKAEERVVTGAGMKYVSVPMSGLTAPTESEIRQILRILEDTTAGPVFVHCWRGADRTGAVIAAYHIDHDRWDNGRALKDAKSHSMSFFQLPRQSFIRSFHATTVDARAESPAASSESPAASSAAPSATPALVLPGVKN